MTPGPSRHAKNYMDATAQRAEARLKVTLPLTEVGITPQVASRLINSLLKSHAKVLTAWLADVATDDVSNLTPEEREHLAFAARYLGYKA